MKYKKARGNTMVLMAIILPVLLGAAGLVIDWGRGVWTRTTLQKAADAGALAGASEIDNETLAALQAHMMVNSNFENPDDSIYQVQGNNYAVVLTENVPAYFMRIFGQASMEVRVAAVATAKRPVSGLRGGAFPWAIINPDLNLDPADDLTDWNFGRPYIIGYGEDNVMVEDWANGTGPPPSSPGQSSNGNGNNNSRGWRGALGLRDDGTLGNAGAVDIRYCMEFGFPGSLKIGDYVPTTQGNMAGPARDGREARLGGDPLPWDDFDQDIDKSDNRVVLVPVIHLMHANRHDTYTVADWTTGADWDNQQVIIDGFAPFFLLSEAEYEPYLEAFGIQGNRHDWVLGYFIPDTETSWFLVDDPDAPDFGLLSPPRLTD